jgi:hypothetical protein
MRVPVNNSDDSDVKIADFQSRHAKSLAVQSAGDDTESLDFFKSRENGNIEKSRLLGRKLAESVLTHEGVGLFKLNSHKEEVPLKTQRRLLLCFVVEIGIEKFTPNKIVARTALNTFYDHLKCISPRVYRDITETGAYSFYYLAYRRGGEVERNIGRAFAALCSMDGSGIYAELGEALYCSFLDVVRKTSDAMRFQ